MTDKLLKVYIGFDPVETVAWHTLTHSILRQSSMPVAIVPINIANLGDIYYRKRDPKQSNEFSFTRFLVPYLSNYDGLAAYFDCDMLIRTDIAELFEHARVDRAKAVHVVKHDYKPRDHIKYLNTVQYKYPRKNWSSVMLWNCAHPSNRRITPDFVNTSSAMVLHRFQWLRDDEIGSLDVRWNWLVGEYDRPPDDIKNIHWTLGGPYFNEYRYVDYAEEWFSEHLKMNHCTQRQK